MSVYTVRYLSLDGKEEYVGAVREHTSALDVGVGGVKAGLILCQKDRVAYMRSELGGQDYGVYALVDLGLGD